jgi:myo-inositol-1(or 4)-monophosphatase
MGVNADDHADAHADHLAVAERAARAAGEILRSHQGRARVSTKGPRDLVTEADIAAQDCVRGILLEAFPTHRFVGEESEGPATALPPAAGTGSGDPTPRPGRPLPSQGDARLPPQQGRPPQPAPTWIVDPLDGTTNYVHGYPAYCVSIALAEQDRLLVGVVHDPVSGETFSASRGGGAWLDGRRLAVSGITVPEDALAAVSFPAHPAAESAAVRDFLAVLPHVQAVRRSGSTALNLAWLAAGRLDVFWVRRIQSWDVAAGLLLVAEAGGTVDPLTRPAGGGQPGEDSMAAPQGDRGVRLDAPAFIAAASPQLVASIRSLLPPAEPCG